MARPLVALLLVTCGKVCALSIAGFLQDQCFLERAHSVAISGNFAYVGGLSPGERADCDGHHRPKPTCVFTKLPNTALEVRRCGVPGGGVVVTPVL